MVKIIGVEPQSIAARAGCRVGDDLLSINGQTVTDFLDYHYLQADEKLSVVIQRGEKQRTIRITKTYDEDLGLEFKPPRVRACGNNCIFCFIKQNPPGLRPAIYFPDEDYRYSFLHGTYITLTNLRSADLQRIARLRLSPLYISVHATDDQVRQRIFQLQRPDHLQEKLTFLREHRIDLHTQIVLLPGINDGQVLERSLQDLYRYREVILSVAIVPVGLTSHRLNLPAIRPVSREDATQLVTQLRRWERRYRNRNGEHWVYLSDEFYLLSGQPLPRRSYYGSCYQIENGVGLTRAFLDDFRRQSRRFPPKIDPAKRVLLITGTLAAPILEREVLPVLRRVENFQVDILSVVNNFFGPSVTVAGLLVGRDIIAQVKHVGNYDQAVLPPRCINADGLLLDDLTPAALAEQLRLPVTVYDGNFLQLMVQADG